MITPVDIENKEFKKTRLSGYDINDVEEFLEKVLIDYEMLYKENAELKDKLNNAQDSISYLNTLEEGVNQAIETSQKISDEIKQKATLEAESMLEKAKSESDAILANIKLDIRTKEAELEKIKKEMHIYKIKVKAMLEAQLKILAEEE